MTTEPGDLTRAQLLLAVLERRLPPSALQELPWDSPELVALTRTHVADLLVAFLHGRITADDVEAWANAIECREDIGHEAGHRDLLIQTIFVLANPLLEGRLTPAAADALIATLRHPPP